LKRSLLTVAVIMSVLVLLSACVRPRGQAPVTLPTPAEATEVVEDFISKRLEGHVSEARGLLSEEAQRTFDESDALRLDLTMSNPHVTGFRLLPPVVQSDEREPGVLVTVRLREAYTGQAYAGRWDERLRVATVNGNPIIDHAEFANRVEATGDEEELVLLVGGDRQIVFEINDLPAEFRPQGAEPGVAFGPGTQGFGALAFSPDGETLAFSTWGVHGFCGVVGLTDGEPQGIDLFFEGSVADIVWSHEGTYLAVEVIEPAGWSRLRLYELPEGSVVPTPLNDELPIEKYALAGAHWLSDVLLEFTAGMVEQGPEQPEKAGTWRLQVDEGALTKIR